MKQRFLFLIYTWLFWVVYFQIARLLFIVYHIKQFLKIPLQTCLQTFIYGWWLDISIASYFSVIPFFLVMISTLKPNILKIIFPSYSIILVVVTSMLIMFDLELFSAWGFRLDATVLRYIDSPTEAWVSTLSSDRKSTRLNSSHSTLSRMPSSA